MKRIFSILFVFLLFFAAGEAAEEKPLKVGINLDHYPFEYKDEDGSPTGVSVDFIKDFADHSGRTIELVELSEDSLLPALQTGKVDLLMSSITITEKRKEIADFSLPYAQDLLAAMVNADSDLQSSADLNKEGLRLAVKSNSAAHHYVQEHFPKAGIVSMEDEPAALVEFEQGRVDAYISDQLLIHQSHENISDSTRVFPMPFKDAQSWGVAFQKGNEELVDTMNEFIEEYRVSGKFEQLTERYLAEEKRAFDQYGFLWYFPSAVEGAQE